MIFRYKYILSTLLFVLASFTVSAANFSSTTDGDWSTNATWGGSSYPALSTADNITINNSVSTTSDVTIKSGGYLTIKAGATLTVHNIEFSNGSHILIEVGGKLVVTGDLVNKNNSVDVEINGDITVDGNFDNGHGGVVFGDGTIQVDGSFTGDGTTFGQTNNSIPSGTTVDGSSLPVELLFFESTSVDGTVLLQWATASETNNDYFTIERSDDGVNFSEISIVNGSGNTNSTTTYEYSDNEPLSGISYYRLKQTDFDGKFEYVGTTACTVNNTIGTIIFENPVHRGNFNITLPSEGTFSIDLYSCNGQLIYHTIAQTSTGFTGITIPSDDLNNGFYLLNVSNQDGFAVSSKLVIE